MQYVREEGFSGVFISFKKKKKYLTVFRGEYSLEFPCLSKGSKPSFALCKVCNVEFKVCHGRRDDCKKHIQSVKYIARSQAVSDNTCI